MGNAILFINSIGRSIRKLVISHRTEIEYTENLIQEKLILKHTGKLEREITYVNVWERNLRQLLISTIEIKK